MPKETLEHKSQIYSDIEILSNQTRIIMLLEVFDIGPDKTKNKERKNNFIALMGKYYQSGIRDRTENLGVTKSSDANKKKLHDQIMEIIRNISLSQGLNKNQQRLTEYLVRNRSEVEKMIGVYFLGYNPDDPQEQSELKQAMRGEGYFGSVPAVKEDE